MSLGSGVPSSQPSFQHQRPAETVGPRAGVIAKGAADRAFAAKFSEIQSAQRARRDAEAQAAAAAAEQQRVDEQARIARRALDPSLPPAPAPSQAEAFRQRFGAARNLQEANAVFADLRTRLGR